MKRPVLVFVVLLFVMILPNLVMAQGMPEEPNDVIVPLDGGLSLLVAAAVGYGSKKMYDARKNKH